MSDTKPSTSIFHHFIFKLNLLTCALCIAIISNDRHSALWLQDLPWKTFGSELAGIITFKPIEAKAAWALWLTLNAVFSVIFLLKTLIVDKQLKKQKEHQMSKPILLRRWDDRLIDSHKMDKRLNIYNPHLKLSTNKFRKILNDIDFSQLK